MQWKSSLLFVVILLCAFSVNRSFYRYIERGAEEWKEKDDASCVPSYHDIDMKFEKCHQKYILLSMQRSGSTWFCSLLDIQDGITCGGHPRPIHSELMIHHTFWKEGEKDDMEWFEYKNDLDKAFTSSCNHTSDGAVGFKLMYNQIPQNFVKDGNLINYLRTNNVSIIHLVREAKILNLVSGYNIKQQWHAFNGSKFFHAMDLTTAEKFRTVNATKMPWDTSTIDSVLFLEKKTTRWQNILQFQLGVQYHYLSYENLLEDHHRNKQLEQILAFLLLSSTPSTSLERPQQLPKVRSNAAFMKLHDTKCSQRLEDYDKFVNHRRLLSTRNTAACKMLEQLPDL